MLGNMSIGLNLLPATPVLGPTILDTPSSPPNPDVLCVQRSNPAPFCENYTKLYSDAKHLGKGSNRRWWNFCFPIFQNTNAHFGQYWKLSKFYRLDPAHHNIQLYNLLMVCLFEPDIRNTVKKTYIFNIFNLIKS